MNWKDDDERAPATSLGRRQVQQNFVTPGTSLAPIVPQRVEVLPPAQHELQQVQPVQVVQRMDTSAVDRARGFTLASVPLAAALGFVAFLAAVGLFGVPWLSLAAVLVLFGTFAGVWLVAWIWHMSASPDGVALWMVLLHYRLLRHEQRARLERMKGVQDDRKP